MDFMELQQVKLTKMTAEERAEYDAAYEEAGAALYAAELFYVTRKAEGLTQAELATKMGLSQSQIAKFEAGKAIPTIVQLESLARAVGHRLEIRLSVT